LLLLVLLVLLVLLLCSWVGRRLAWRCVLACACLSMRIDLFEIVLGDANVTPPAVALVRILVA